MATPTTTVSGLRIEDQSVAFTISIDGPADIKAGGAMIIYDATGVERARTDLGELGPSPQWDVQLDVPVAALGDGDFTAWVLVVTETADGHTGGTAEAGVSFLVGRGRVYPSREQAVAQEMTVPPTISPLRLEGSWVVFDMTNNEAYDVAVTHELSLGQEGGEFQQLRGQELLHAHATQQGHHLLPDGLADGTYEVFVMLHRDGSAIPNVATARILVDGGVLTMVP